MAAWMTTLHMFFFCSFIFLIFKGLILIYESTGLQVYESGHYLLTCCLLLYALQRYNIGKGEKALRGVAWKNVEIGGIRGNYCAANAW